MSRFHRLIAGIFVVIVFAGGTVIVLDQRAPTKEANLEAEPEKIENINIPKPLEPVRVSLPNAQPVVAIDEDYNLDDSFWRVVSRDYPLSDDNYRPTSLQIATVSSRTDKS